MSKTTLKKKTKKPDPKASGERALNKRKIAMEEEALRIRRIVSKMLEPVIDQITDRLTALESRSAPAEEWFPKVGDYVTPAIGMDTMDEPYRVHDPREVGEVMEVGANALVKWPSNPIAHWYSYELEARIKPATSAEIASHKAKEERQKELDKPLTFGTKVRTTQGDGFVHGIYGDGCTHPTGRWWIAFPHNVLNHYDRRDLTILDQPSDR